MQLVSDTSKRQEKNCLFPALIYLITYCRKCFVFCTLQDAFPYLVG